jgi:protein O-GlcNAc transferase
MCIRDRNNKGVALKNLGDFDSALSTFNSAITLKPNHSDAHINRAALLESHYRLEEALASYDHILGYDPQHVMALFNRGRNYALQKRHLEAIADFKKATEIEPENYNILAHLLSERARICEWISFDKNAAKLHRGLTKSNSDVPPLSIARLLDAPDLMLKAARKFSAGETPVKRQEFVRKSLEGRKIRIGYVSSDLHEKHPVFQALAGTMACHNVERFEVHYFLLPHIIAQPKPALLSTLSATVHDLQGLSDAEMLTRIRAVELDIAIDLNGFTKFHSIQLWREGIAPVQINYLGSPGSMGHTSHDYIIGDSALMPLESFGNYAEKIVLLPHSFFPVDTTRPHNSAVPTRAEAGLPSAGFVFGYFGMADRILPDVFASWMRILKSVSGSVLWLKLANGPARTNILKEAQVHFLHDFS